MYRHQQFTKDSFMSKPAAIVAALNEFDYEMTKPGEPHYSIIGYEVTTAEPDRDRGQYRGDWLITIIYRTYEMPVFDPGRRTDIAYLGRDHPPCLAPRGDNQ